MANATKDGVRRLVRIRRNQTTNGVLAPVQIVKVVRRRYSRVANLTGLIMNHRLCTRLKIRKRQHLLVKGRVKRTLYTLLVHNP